MARSAKRNYRRIPLCSKRISLTGKRVPTLEGISQKITGVAIGESKYSRGALAHRHVSSVYGHRRDVGGRAHPKKIQPLVDMDRLVIQMMLLGMNSIEFGLDGVVR